MATQPFTGGFKLQAIKETGAGLLVEIKVKACQQVLVLQRVLHQQRHPGLILTRKRGQFRSYSFTVGERGCLHVGLASLLFDHGR